MSLSDAKRVLQWNVVMAALAEAGVDPDTTALVEQARSASDLFQSMAQLMLGGAEIQQAKNYVKFEMTGLTLPFDRAYIELVRPGGKTSHELRGVLRACLVEVHGRLMEGTAADPSMRETISAALADTAP